MRCVGPQDKAKCFMPFIGKQIDIVEAFDIGNNKLVINLAKSVISIYLVE